MIAKITIFVDLKNFIYQSSRKIHERDIILCCPSFDFLLFQYHFSIKFEKKVLLYRSFSQSLTCSLHFWHLLFEGLLRPLKFNRLRIIIAFTVPTKNLSSSCGNASHLSGMNRCANALIYYLNFFIVHEIISLENYLSLCDVLVHFL